MCVGGYNYIMQTSRELITILFGLYSFNYIDKSTNMNFFVASVLFSLISSSYVAADYQLTVTVHSFSNPDNKCAECRNGPLETFGCCDNHAVKVAAECSKITRPCEVVLSACFQPHTSQVDRALCPGGNTFFRSGYLQEPLTSSLIVTDTDTTWDTTASQLYIALNDDDFSNGFELIDSFPINVTIGTRISQRTLTGQYGLATIELSLSLECTENYYGPDCSLFRVCSQPPCTCDPGFTGEFCQTNINECSGVDCSGSGVCIDGVNSYTCQCEDGYTGNNCQVNVTGVVVGVLLGTLVLAIIIIIVILVVVFMAKRNKAAGNWSINGEKSDVLHMNAAFDLTTSGSNIYVKHDLAS